MQLSQSQDLEIAINELSEAINNTETLKTQLETCSLLAKKQAEEIDVLSKLGKRARIISYVEMGLGIPMLAASYIPGIKDEWKRTLFISGATLTASGAATFVITIRF